MQQLRLIRSWVKRVFKRFRAWISATDNALLLAYFRWVYKPKPGSLEAFLDGLSRTRGAGFFVVQVGANDGITHDPVHKFIKRDRWSGILMEPQERVFRSELVPLYRRHKNLSLVNAALGHTPGKATLYTVAFSNDRWATGIARFDRASLEGLFANGSVAAQARKAGLEVPDEDDKRILGQAVNVVTAQQLLTAHNVRHIDLLIVDTEGFDAEVVKMFTTQEPLPQAIVFERIHLSDSDRLSCREMLASKNYRLRDLGPNTLAWQE